MILIKELFHSSRSKGPVLRTKACWEMRQYMEHKLINYTRVHLHTNMAASQTILSKTQQKDIIWSFLLTRDRTRVYIFVLKYIPRVL